MAFHGFCKNKTVHKKVPKGPCSILKVLKMIVHLDETIMAFLKPAAASVDTN